MATGLNNSIGQSNGLSYLDQLKSLHEKNKPEKVTGGKNQLKQEDFMALLTKQLSQQDPFKPAGSDQMIAQMASFATVDGIGKMNKQFDSLNNSMTSNQALQASTLVGRYVLVPGSTGSKKDADGMAAMVKLPKAVNDLVVRVKNEAGQLVKTFSVGPKAPGDTRLEWDGTDENGKLLPEGKYTFQASGMVSGKSSDFDISTYANVDSVVLGKGDGSIMLNLAGFKAPVNLTEVLEVGKV